MSAIPCTLCPRRCGALRPQSGAENAALPGFCRSPRNPVVARAALHFWEEPVISGKRGSGTVFFSGCNLHCVFCQNHSISTLGGGKEITVARLKEIYRELIARGAHNINLVTPTHYVDAVAASLDETLPVPVVYNCGGYELPETIAKLAGKVSIYLPDLKYADDALGAKYSFAPDYFERAAEAIDAMVAQIGNFEIGEDGMMKRGVIVRHLILPGQVENSFRVIDYVAHHFRPGQVMFSLMRQYLPAGAVSESNFPELNRRVTDEEYELVEAALMASGIEDGFVQESDSADEKFIPAFDGTGV